MSTCSFLVAGINTGKIEMTGEVGEILPLVINSHYTLSSCVGPAKRM